MYGDWQHTFFYLISQSCLLLCKTLNDLLATIVYIQYWSFYDSHLFVDNYSFSIRFDFNEVFKCPTRVGKFVKQPEWDVEFEFDNTAVRPVPQIDNTDMVYTYNFTFIRCRRVSLHSPGNACVVSRDSSASLVFPRNRVTFRPYDNTQCRRRIYMKTC